MTQPLEAAAEQLFQLLWQQHLEKETQYLWIGLASPFIGLLFFLLLLKARGWQGHLKTLGQRLWFFFAPWAPEYMVVVADQDGYWVDYRLNLIPGERGWIVKVAGREYVVLEDPRKHARPVDIWGLRGPPGAPSGPFHAAAALVIGWLMAFVFATIALSKTIYVTVAVFGMQPTAVDAVVMSIFTAVLIYWIRNVLSLSGITGLYLALARIPPSRMAVPVDPSPASLASWTRLLYKALGREFSPEGDLEKAILKLKQELGDNIDEWSAAAILAEAAAARTFREKLSYLEETIDHHIEAAEAALLRTGYEERGGRLQRWAPFLAIAAIIVGVVALVAWLHPSVEAANATATMAANVSNATVVTPAAPPSPPTATTTPPVAPPSPPQPGPLPPGSPQPPIPPSPPGAG